jgi:hypothetical protein
MENQIIITKERLKMAYKNADEQQKKLLENLFSKELVIEEYGDIRDKIKTYEDACNYLYITPTFFSVNQTVDEIAYIKLKTICKALNEKWVPQFTKDEYCYYPWFYLYTKEEWNKLSDDMKEYGVLFGGNSNDGAACGFGFSFSDCTPSGSAVYIGSRLCLRSRKLAEYCGEQFIKLWLDYLM